MFASGFEVHLSHFAAYETVGRDGLKLSEHWADGMRTLHGAHTHGFPNLFIEGLAQGANLISNISHNLNEVGQSIAAVISHAEETGAEQVEVTEAAQDDWAWLLEGNARPFLANPDCTPGYYNKEGGEITKADRLNTAGYPLGPAAYFAYIDQWRSRGDFEGLEFRS